jgi:hypothetical protein
MPNSLPFESKLPFEEQGALPFEEVPWLQRDAFLPEVARTVDTGVRNLADMAVTLPLMVGGGLASLVSKDAGDEIFKRMETAQEMLHEGEVRPESLLGKVVSNLIPMTAGIAGGGTGMATMLLGGGAKSGQHLINAGVDPKTAAIASGIDVGTNLAGAGAKGGRVVQGLVNVGVGAGSDWLVQKYLEEKGYNEVAKNYDPFDVERRLTDFGAGMMVPPRKPRESKLSESEIEALRRKVAERKKAAQEATPADNNSFYEQLPLDLQFKQKKDTLQDLINRTEEDLQPAQRDLFTQENFQRNDIARNISQWEQPKVPEYSTKGIEQEIAWREREQQLGKTVWDYLNEPTLEPSQGGQSKFGFGSSVGHPRGGKQSGYIDPMLLTFGIPKLIDYIKEKGIPVEKLVSKFKGTFYPDAVDIAIKEAQDPNSHTTLIWMKPQDFLDLVLGREPYQRDMKGQLSESRRGSIRMGLETEKGLEELPLLRIREGPEGAAKTIGHEGRHRMDVFIENGLELVPVRVQHDMGRWGAQKLSYDKVIPQGEDKTIPLPIKLDPIFKLDSNEYFPNGLKRIGGKQTGALDISVFVPESFINSVKGKVDDLFKNTPKLAQHLQQLISRDPKIKDAILEQALYYFNINHPVYGKDALWNRYTENKVVTSDISFGFVKTTPLEKALSNYRLPSVKKTKEFIPEIEQLYQENKNDYFGGEYKSLEAFSKAEPEHALNFIKQKLHDPLFEIAGILSEEIGAREKNRIPGLTSIGKSQRGSIGFKREPKPDMSFDEFKKSLPEDLVRDAEWLYKDTYGVSDLGKVDIGTNEQTVAALDKFPGLKGLLPVETKPSGEMLPIWKNEQDIPLNVFRDSLSSGGRMTALRTNNSYVNWVVEKINSALKDTEVISNKASHDIISAANRLKKLFNDSELIDTIRELASKEGKKEGLNLKTESQHDLANTIRKSWDDLYAAINEVRASRGMGPVPYRPNYLTAIFKGPYRGLVRDARVSPDGKPGPVIGVVGAKTMKEAKIAVEELTRLASEKGLQVKIEEPTFSPVFASKSFQKNIGSHYVQMNELMNIFGNESPTGRAFQDMATEWYDRRVLDHLGYRQHFKNKVGVYGAEGNKPWKDIRENALDLLDAQVAGLQAGWQWVAQQRVAQEIHTVFNAPETKHLVNATEYLTKYYDHAFNRGTNTLDPIRLTINALAKQAGVDPAPVFEILGMTRNGALVNTLGLSGAFVLSQLVQVPQALVASTAFLREKGISSNAYASFIEGLYDFSGSRLGRKEVSQEGQFAYKYFTEHGVFDPHIMEKQIPRKLISTSGMSGVKKALTDGLINGPVWAVETYNKHLGRISLELVERASRGTYAMAMFHYLRRAGFDNDSAVKMADKMTSQFFVDYNPHERAMIWESMGEFGKFASTVTTYKLNALNQLATFNSHKAYKTAAASMLALGLLSGVTGLPGFDELEDIFSFMKRYVSPDISTPREILLKEAPDALTFGALASVTDTNLQTKFNQGNIFPDDLSSFIFPLGRVVYNVGEAALDVIANPSKETGGRLAWEVSPGGLKAPIEKNLFTTEEGISLNPRKVGKGQYEQVGIGFRDESDWNKRMLGATSLRESKAKEMQFMMTRDKEIRDKRISNHLTNAMQDISTNNTEKLQTDLQKYFTEGGTEDALTKRLNSSVIGKNTDIKTRLLLGIKSGTLRDAIEAKSLNEYLKNEVRQ